MICQKLHIKKKQYSIKSIMCKFVHIPQDICLFQRRFIYGLTALSLCVAQTGFAFTLEQAVKSALQTNPAIGRAIESLRASEQLIKVTEARFLPTLKLSSYAGYQYHHEGSGTNASRSGTNYNGTLTLSHNVFDGGSAHHEVERNNAQALSSRYKVNEAAETTALNAVQVYLQTLQERELTALAEDNVRRHQEH